MDKKIQSPSISSIDLHPSDCFVCGPDNEKGLHTPIPFDEKTGEVNFEHEFHGFEKGAPGKVRLVHGGAIAAILDEAQGVLAHHIGHLVMTDRLNIRYHKGTPLMGKVIITAKITMVKKRRLYTKAFIHNLQGELLVSSTGKWFILPDRLVLKLFAYNDEMGALRIEQLEKNRIRAKQIRKQIRSKK